VVGSVGARVPLPIRFLNTYGDPLTHYLLPSQWSVADSSVAAYYANSFIGLKVGQTVVTATRGNKSANALLQFVNPIPPRIFGTWTGTWESTNNTPRSGSLSVTISGNQFSWTAVATWTEDGITYSASASSGFDGSVLSADPLLSASSIGFIAGYHAPGSSPSSHLFTRHFGLETKAPNVNVMSGNSYDGFPHSDSPNQEIWAVNLTRPTP
jgi:hypothetical protein